MVGVEWWGEVARMGEGYLRVERRSDQRATYDNAVRWAEARLLDLPSHEPGGSI